MNLDHPVLAIDGEGYTDSRGRHRYTYVAACTDKRLVSELHRPRGIQTPELFNWLLSLPAESTLVGFALGYDFCKWVEGMRDGAIYSLTHPDLRTGDHGPRAVKWQGYRVNKVSRKFSVSRGGAHRIVWDVWSFFQTSFVVALKKWGVGSPTQVARIARMKDRRAAFAGIGPRERSYCREECRLLARLVRELLDAHADAGLELQSLYGPGSTASVMLDAMGAADHNVKGSPAFMRAVSQAFFGGRFEQSRVGPVAVPLHAVDLASAYPYAWCLLPCFEHGRWKRVGAAACRRHVEKGRLALVHYRLDPPHGARSQAWGPLPHRLPNGNIVFPAASAGGWAWSPEIVAGCALHDGIAIRGGYLFEPRCRCGHPFRASMVAWYKERLKWGNKGRGRVLRLGMNSCTGKAMQSVGKPRWRCLVRAGLVTSLTRARLLEAIATARDPWSVVELATDSVLSTEPLKLAPPVDLGTQRAARRAGSSPLGAWDASPVNPDGSFLCRPGMRFRLGDGAEPDETAARGMGVKTLHAARGLILASWQREPMAPVEVPTGRMFIGAKSAIRRVGRLWAFKRSPDYGRWVQPPPRKLSFSPMPKRDACLPGAPGAAVRLSCWELPQGREYESVPYDEETESPELEQLRTEEDVRDEQG